MNYADYLDDPEIDDRRFMKVGDVVIGRVTVDGLIEVKDKNHARAKQRGRDFVYYTPEQMSKTIKAYLGRE